MLKEEVFEFLKGKIASYEMPVHVDFVDSFPVTHNGKVRKAELRKQKEERIENEKA